MDKSIKQKKRIRAILSFGIMFVVICVIFNGVFLLVFGRTQEFQYLWGIVRRKMKKR